MYEGGTVLALARNNHASHEQTVIPEPEYGVPGADHMS